MFGQASQADHQGLASWDLLQPASLPPEIIPRNLLYKKTGLLISSMTRIPIKFH